MNYFLIVSLRRCGSTYCASELDSYSDIYCQYEFVYRPEDTMKISHKRINLEQKDFSFPSAIDSFSDNSSIRGSKVTIPDYQADQVTKIIKIIKRDKIKVIHIIRSLHEQMVSQKNVEKSGIYHILQHGQDDFQECFKNSNRHFKQIPDSCRIEYKYNFTPQEAETFCRNVTTIDEEISRLKYTNPYILLRYNDINSHLEKILLFLNMNKKTNNYRKIKKQSLQKVIQSDHKDMIENWTDVQSIFEKWELEREKKVFSP